MLATFSNPHMHQQAFQQRASTSMEGFFNFDNINEISL